MNHLGLHFIAEFYNCDSSVINDASAIESILTDAVDISGATIIHPFFHRFSPHGISGVIIIAESHFAIHTWPEHAYAAVDIFSCGDFRYLDALRFIRENLKSGNSIVNRISRGLAGISTTFQGDLLTEKIVL